MIARLLQTVLLTQAALLLGVHGLLAQEADSIKVLQDIEIAESDSAKQRAYNRAATYFIYKDLDRALSLVHAGESIGPQDASMFGRAELRNTRGMIHDQLGNSTEAFADMQQALEWSELHHFASIEGMVHNNLGLFFWKEGNYDKALEHFDKAMGLNEATGAPDLESKAIHLNNIGLIHQELQRYNKALDFHREALEIRRSLGLKGEEAISLANMGLCHRGNGNLEWAEDAFVKAIALADSLGNTHLYLAFHGNLGNVYYTQGKLHQALEAYLISLGDDERIAQHPKSSFHAYSNLAAVMNALENPAKAQDYGEQALKILEAHPGYLAFAAPILRSMAQSHFMLGDIAGGNDMLDRYAAARDSIFTQNHANSLAHMEVKYETAKKEYDLSMQASQLSEQEAKMQRNLILTIALGLIALLSVLLLLALINRNKRKAQLAARERDLLLRETEMQAEIRMQEEERKRFARDLHDGMGQLISTLKLTVARLKDQHGDPYAEKIVKESDGLLDDMHTEIRNIAFNLMPSTLIEAGLGAGIREFAERLNQTNGIQIDTDLHLHAALDEKEEIALYRIVQEWVNNVVKYADASHVLIQVVGDARELSIVIEDNGQGFDTKKLSKGNGNGWRNILLRCKGINAIIDVDSVEGRPGTTFVLEMQLMEQKILATEKEVNRA